MCPVEDGRSEMRDCADLGPSLPWSPRVPASLGFPPVRGDPRSSLIWSSPSIKRTFRPTYIRRRHPNLHTFG
ncbi:hypothetical protein CMUS01_13910 [Colletotrichum musicola]|uniref:Uncharacterized protein n=1 Tax=Colletotrichum musicola TaxID=2175873 RepID=A0A8H6J8H4_9PEZI|nr:hypothetical protein CMUS01_13910 [Colletotrichum musicola]